MKINDSNDFKVTFSLSLLPYLKYIDVFKVARILILPLLQMNIIINMLYTPTYRSKENHTHQILLAANDLIQ